MTKEQMVKKYEERTKIHRVEIKCNQLVGWFDDAALLCCAMNK